MASRHYKNAPIIEAVIELRADFGSTPVPEQFAASLQKQFPTAKPLAELTMSFRKEEEKAAEFGTQEKLVGTRFDSIDGKRVLQIHRAAFIYSHLAPYSEWKTFRDECRNLWMRYREHNRVAQVTRLAVRVINRIGLPSTAEDLATYSNLRLFMPGDLRATNERQFTQVQLKGDWAGGSRVIVNLGTAGTPDGKLGFLLDLDVFVERAVEASSDEVWTTLDQLSAAKNDIFEACITDATRELIA
jgi:uncharacterized protein (TIGR04255 family)